MDSGISGFTSTINQNPEVGRTVEARIFGKRIDGWDLIFGVKDRGLARI